MSGAASELGVCRVSGALSDVFALGVSGEGGRRTAQAVSENRPAMTAIIGSLKPSFSTWLKSCPSVPGPVYWKGQLSSGAPGQDIRGRLGQTEGGHSWSWGASTPFGLKEAGQELLFGAQKLKRVCQKH